MSLYKDIKEECYEANILLPESKLVDLTFGNVSVCDSKLAVFAIKPSGVDYKKLKPEEMVVVDFNDKVVEGLLKPSSDTSTHRRLFEEFKGIRSVVHTHSRNAVAFAAAGKGIPCLNTTHADYFYGEVPVTRAMTPKEIQSNYELKTGNVIIERFKKLNPLEIPAVLVRSHGPFTWGPSGKKAMENAFALEIIAEMAWKTLEINPKAKPISQALLNVHYLRKHGPKATYGQ